MSATKPTAQPIWTAWPAVTDDGIPMARVKVAVGQYEFQAGSQYDPADPMDFAAKVHNVMTAIGEHARRQGWLK